MALHIQLVSPVTPEVLLENIREQINNGVIDTWEIDSDGDLTHTPYQWKGEAWFRYRQNGNELIFGIVARRDRKMSKVIYGLYHGRFAEMLLTHFDTQIKEITISSMPEEYDLI